MITYPLGLSYLQEELANNTAFTTAQHNTLSTAIAVLAGTSTAITHDEALSNCNDLYFDATLRNRSWFSQAVNGCSFTVNPDRPYPKIRA